MSRFFIEKIKVRLTAGGIPDRNVIVTIQYHKEDGKTQWISNVECGGICTIYLNDYDPFDLLVSGDAENPKWGVGVINEFEGIKFNDYEDLIHSFADNKDSSTIQILRLLIALTRGSDEEISSLISKSEGKYIDEIDVPISDIEEDYNKDDKEL